MTLLLMLCFLSPFFSAGAQTADPYHMDYSTSEPLEYDDSDQQPQNNGKAETLDLGDKLDDQDDNVRRTPTGFINTGYTFFPIYERVDASTTAGGLDFAYYFRRQGEDPKSVPNSIRALFTAGQNQYVNTGISFDNYWNDGYHNIFAFLGYLRRPANFYQIAATDPQLLGTYRATDVNFNILYRQKVFDDTYLGAIYDYESDNIGLRVPSNVFNDKVFPGLTGSISSGFGVVFGNMPNVSIFSPHTSFAYEITNILYLSAFGSTSDFGKHTFDVREYVGLFPNHLIALQLYMNFLSGTPTYSQLSSVGDIFRAYYHDKYLDYHVITIRGEYRWTLFDRFMLTAFLGAGYHSSALSKFRLNNYLPSYGAGFRYLLSEELNSFVRLEYFEGRGSRGFMLGLGDDF